MAEESIADVFELVQSSVVTIHTTAATGLVSNDGEVQTESGNGSGVLLENGQIFTAAHVVHSADTVVVEYMDGTRSPATVVSSVPQVDVALLRVDNPIPKGVKPAVLGNSDDVRIGSKCFVVGAPRGINHTLTVGHVSARRTKDHEIDLLDNEHFQTDAAINPGNSGGPMFDMEGRVIGIVVFIAVDSEGLGFAVTSNTAKKNLLERSPVWSGMTEIFLSGEIAEAFQIPEGRSGFLIQRVAKGSAADRLGIRGGSIPVKIGNTELLLGGDIIVEAFGYELDSIGMGLQIMNAMKDIKSDSYVNVKVLRKGRVITLQERAGKIAPWLR